MLNPCTSYPELRLNVRHAGEFEKVGKTDPLIFAADVVTNHLWRHLDALASTASLNDASSLADWPLADITFCDPRPGASMLDKL